MSWVGDYCRQSLSYKQSPNFTLKYDLGIFEKDELIFRCASIQMWSMHLTLNQ